VTEEQLSEFFKKAQSLDTGLEPFHDHYILIFNASKNPLKYYMLCIRNGRSPVAMRENRMSGLTRGSKLAEYGWFAFYSTGYAFVA